MSVGALFGLFAPVAERSRHPTLLSRNQSTMVSEPVAAVFSSSPSTVAATHRAPIFSSSSHQKKQLQHTEHDERTLLHSLRPPRVTEPSAQSTPIIPRSLAQPAEPAVVRPSAALSAPFIFVTHGPPRSPERGSSPSMVPVTPHRVPSAQRVQFSASSIWSPMPSVLSTRFVHVLGERPGPAVSRAAPSSRLFRGFCLANQ